MHRFLSEESNINILITSIRDGVDPMRYVLLDTLLSSRAPDFELPLAKTTRKNKFVGAWNWYRNGLQNLGTQILRNQPFNFILKMFSNENTEGDSVCQYQESMFLLWINLN
ncbi:hypothetical protein CLV59_1073 [Chitinophaga dinghuensis]|uniref:Uncharacterized protein n=1 Tax=Chitinophaga dinghuensis TaxID=1539050 RepID=A0A327VTG4_9BACT|nr:hypothetical protein CLV59_1073 [Chitinophaga dinghuensis]